MSLVVGGKTVANNIPQVTLTEAEFNALDDSVKNDPTINFFIKDGVENDYARLLNLLTIVGDQDALANLPTGTVIGAIADLFTRLDGISFSIDPEYTHLIATKSDENPRNDIQQLAEDATDHEKIAWLQTVLGDSSKLTEKGYDSIVNALIDLYAMLDGLKFNYNEAENPKDDTVSVTDTTQDAE